MSLCPKCTWLDDSVDPPVERLENLPLRGIVIDQPGTKRGLIIAQWCECGYVTDERVKDHLPLKR